MQNWDHAAQQAHLKVLALFQLVAPLPDLVCRSWLEDAEPDALSMRGQARQRPPERERLVTLEAEALGHHGSPEGEDGRTVDLDRPGQS